MVIGGVAGHEGHYRVLNTVLQPVLLCVTRCYTVGQELKGGLSGDNTLHLFLNRRHGGKWMSGSLSKAAFS